MICPQCQAEYRDGFTVCADCDVPLVTSSRTTVTDDEEDRPESSDIPSSLPERDDPYCAFWEGEDTRIFAEICTVLDEADIPYRSLRHDSQIFRISPNSKMKIGVPFSQYEKAELAVVNAFGGEAETKKLLWPDEEDRPEYTALVSLPLDVKLHSERTPAVNSPQAGRAGDDSTADATVDATENPSETFEHFLPDEPNGNSYCPLCIAEYREGFAICSDCRVALVATRAEARSSRARLWKGDHQREMDLILRALDADQIPAHYREIVNAISRIRIVGIPIGPNRSAFEYEVWVFRKDLEKAQTAIQSTLPQDLDD